MESDIIKAIDKLKESNEKLISVAYNQGFKSYGEHIKPAEETKIELNKLNVEVSTMKDYMKAIDKKMENHDEVLDKIHNELKDFINNANIKFEQKDLNRNEHKELRVSLEEYKDKAESKFASKGIEDMLTSINRKVWITIIIFILSTCAFVAVKFGLL